MTTGTVTEQWTRFFDICFSKRIRPENFYPLARQLTRRTPILGIKLADILIGRQAIIRRMCDPLIPDYAEILLENNRISSADLLAALYRHSISASLPGESTQDESKSPKKDDNTVYNTAELEACIFDVLARAYLPGGERPKTQDEVRVALKMMSLWLEAIVARGTALGNETSLATETNHEDYVEQMQVFESFGALSISMLENVKVAGVIDVMLSKTFKKKLAASLTSFVQFWSTAAPQHVHNATRLEMAQRNRSLLDEATTATQEAEVDVAAALQVESVADLPVMHARPHVFVFLSSLLAACPLTDESMMMNYLHVRYNGDAPSLATDLMVATFDVLAAAAERSESANVMFSLKSFLVNKIPLLLATLTGSLLTPEFAIQQALSHVDMNVFPTAGLGMLQGNTALQDTRQDFVYSCILHGLLTSDSVGRLLGEQTFDSPPSPHSRLQKDTLVQQCSMEPGKLSQLIGQLEKLDGNAGAIVGAITDSIRTACVAKDTMSLKTTCNALTAKPQFLDVVLQFTSPASVLQPVCQLLDTWKYEDDQGESQPVYDEFASIFLLVLTFIYRYEFSHVELGISKDSFVAKYLAQGHREVPGSQLSEEQQKHLGSWVKGLFDPDGITEEVTASCQPQQFYMLVPTIFSQTIFACSNGVLNIDAIKSGLEYLSEPFLLPSLVDAIHWLTSYVREYPGVDTDIIIQVLQRVTRAPSSSEAQAMHSTIMAIVALPLLNCLRTLVKNNPKRTDIQPIAQLFRQHMDFRRGPYNRSQQQLNAWLHQPGGLKLTVRNYFQSLINWSIQASAINPAQLPPQYDHRLFLFAELVLGAPALLFILLFEIKQQTENPAGAAAVAMDIATAIVCAPTSRNSPIPVGWVASPVAAQYQSQSERLNLRDALALDNERAVEIMKKDNLMAETVVRLHRRVEQQCNIGVAPLADIASQMPAQDLSNMLPDLGLAGPSQNAGPGPGLSQQPSFDLGQDGMGGLDMGAAGDMPLDLGGGDDTMGLMGTGDENIFDGLDFGMGDGDGMDLDWNT